MIEPDDDYENPIGEVLDDDTLSELRNTNFVESLVAILVKAGWKWPFT